MKNLIILLVVLIVSCGDGGGSSTPEKPNFSPSISGSISKIRVGETLNFIPTYNDVDGDILTFSITGKPNWATFNTTSGLLSGIPLSENLGETYSITISVTDGQYTSSTTPFSLTVTKPIFFINVGLVGMDPHRNMDVELEACLITNPDISCSEGDELLTIYENGIFSFEAGLETGTSFEIKVDRDPGRQDCSLDIVEGVIGSDDQDVSINCVADASVPLFALDKMHKIRLIMSVKEWDRFVLDTERARYTNGDANNNPIGFWTHSEIYRQVNFEYLDDNNNVIESLEKVGFKMKGNTSRQWPEFFYDDDNGNSTAKPKRFSFTIKFDEEFDEDEGVYSCIDASGTPASIEGHPCYSRVGKDLEEVPSNDGREFMDLEKIFFRYNRDDPSYQRELLAHDILNTIGVPTSRVAHANVELKIVGEGSLFGRSLPQIYNMGVFQMVEQIDKNFLKRFYGKNGYLFKIGPNADLAGSTEIDPNCYFYEYSSIYVDPNFCQIGVEKSDPDSREEWLGSYNYLIPEFVNSDINDGGEESQFKPYRPTYDLKSKKSSISDGRVLLQDFIKFVQTYPSALILADEFDVPGFIKAQAAEIVIGAVDHYVRVGNNYYLYFNPLIDKWIYMVSDFDFVFRDSHDTSDGKPYWASAFRDIAQTYAFPEDGKIDWASRELGSVDPILWDIVFSEQNNKDLLYFEINSIIDNYMNWDNLSNLLLARNALVEEAINGTEAGLPDGCGVIYNSAAIDADAGTPLCDMSDISIKRFIELRKAALKEELILNGYLTLED